MPFYINISAEAENALSKLEQNKAVLKQFKAVTKALKFIATNPKHPSLNTHKFKSLHGPNGEEIFEAYAENHSPGAYRIFWYYGPQKQEITIFDIMQHP